MMSSCDVIVGYDIVDNVINDAANCRGAESHSHAVSHSHAATQSCGDQCSK